MSEVVVDITQTSTSVTIEQNEVDVAITQTSTSVSLGNAGPQGGQGPEGPEGPQGETGPEGPTGPSGQDSSARYQFRYSTSTTDGDPGAGYFRLNNSTMSSATFLYIDTTDYDPNAYPLGNDLSTFLSRLTDYGSSTNRGFIKVEKASDNTWYQQYVFSSVTENSGYYTIGLQNVISDGNFSDNDICFISFILAGPGGEQGPEGPEGPQGPQGPEGPAGPQPLIAPLNSGFYYTADSPSSVSRSFTLNTVYYAPYVFPYETNVTRLGVMLVTTALSNGVKLGIYADSNGQPGTKVAETTQIQTSSTTTGFKYETVDVTVDSGLYWLAFLNQGSVPSTFYATSGKPYYMPQGDFDNPPTTIRLQYYGFNETNVTGDLPETANPIFYDSSNFPRIFFGVGS